MLPTLLMLLDDNDEREAFEALYYRYRTKMFQIALAILRDVQLAEDAVADAFFSIATHFKRIEALPANARIGYCVIVTRNAALSIRAQKLRLQELLCGNLENATARETAPHPEQLETDELLDLAMQEISVQQRDCIMLRYYYGFHVREISEMLHIKLETVRSRIRRGKKVLRPKLRELYAEEYGYTALADPYLPPTLHKA